MRPGTARIAHGEEAIVVVPVIVEPIEVQVPLRPVVPEIEHVSVAVQVPHSMHDHHDHCPLNTLGTVSYLGAILRQWCVPSIVVFEKL